MKLTIVYFSDGNVLEISGESETRNGEEVYVISNDKSSYIICKSFVKYIKVVK